MFCKREICAHTGEKVLGFSICKRVNKKGFGFLFLMLNEEYEAAPRTGHKICQRVSRQCRFDNTREGWLTQKISQARKLTDTLDGLFQVLTGAANLLIRSDSSTSLDLPVLRIEEPIVAFSPL